MQKNRPLHDYVHNGLFLFDSVGSRIKKDKFLFIRLFILCYLPENHRLFRPDFHREGGLPF